MPTLEEVIPSRTKEFFTRLKEVPFDPGATEGDIGNAWFCAEASALAYKDSTFIDEFSKQKLEPFGWTARVYEQGSTQAVLLLSNEAAVLAFRGTRVAGFSDLLREAPINFQDLWVDFSAVLLHVEDHGRMHKGFFTTFQEFWKQRGRTIVERIGTRPLHLTGHSLGGALATVAARRMANKQIQFEPGHLGSLYTFGSPTVGDQTFRMGFETSGFPVLRFVHGHDLVTTVAPSELQYAHVGEMIHIDGSEAGTLSRREQHTLLQSLRYNMKHGPAGFVKLVTQLGDIFSTKLPKISLPQDALVEHAPINYCRKLAHPDLSRKLPIL